MNHPNRPCHYIVRTASGHLWLIERARSETDALEQYHRGGAEDHVSVSRGCGRAMVQYLRGQGQAS